MVKKQKYYLTEEHSSDGVWWCIEKGYPNSGRCVYLTRNEKDAKREILRLNSRSRIYCFIMNVIDFRFWQCDCSYYPPYGLCKSIGCKKHD